jgi:pilus assembly protein CpaF
LNIPETATRRQIASALDLIVQVSRMSDGTRKIVSITEVVGMEGDIMSMQDIFNFNRTGLGDKGEVLGEFLPTGVRPRLCERLLAGGLRLPAGMFDRPKGF